MKLCQLEVGVLVYRNRQYVPKDPRFSIPVLRIGRRGLYTDYPPFGLDFFAPSIRSWRRRLAFEIGVLWCAFIDDKKSRLTLDAQELKQRLQDCFYCEEKGA